MHGALGPFFGEWVWQPYCVPLLPFSGFVLSEQNSETLRRSFVSYQSPYLGTSFCGFVAHSCLALAGGPPFRTVQSRAGGPPFPKARVAHLCVRKDGKRRTRHHSPTGPRRRRLSLCLTISSATTESDTLHFLTCSRYHRQPCLGSGAAEQGGLSFLAW